MPGEFTLIDRIQARATARADVALGIGDDAALLRVPDGQLLAVSTDTLVGRLAASKTLTRPCRAVSVGPWRRDVWPGCHQSSET